MRWNVGSRAEMIFTSAAYENDDSAAAAAVTPDVWAQWQTVSISVRFSASIHRSIGHQTSDKHGLSAGPKRVCLYNVLFATGLAITDRIPPHNITIPRRPVLFRLHWVGYFAAADKHLIVAETWVWQWDSDTRMSCICTREQQWWRQQQHQQQQLR